MLSVPNRPTSARALIRLAACLAFFAVTTGASAVAPTTTIPSATFLTGQSTHAELFGETIAMDGARIAIGVPDRGGADVCTGFDQRKGAVLLYEENIDGPQFWGRAAELVSDDLLLGDRFGATLALSGDTLVVGAPRADTAAGANAGAVYVFRRVSGVWSQIRKLAPSTAQAGAEFGTSVALNGDVLIVGAPLFDGAGGANSGGAWLFARNQGGAEQWGETQALAATGAAAGDNFGAAVALAAGVAVVGAPLKDSTTVNAGAAFVFTANSGPFLQVQQLQATTAALDAAFGKALGLDGARLAVGAPNDPTVASGAGAVFVFVFSAAQPQPFSLEAVALPRPTGNGTVPPTNARLGSAVAVSGSRVAASAPGALYNMVQFGRRLEPGIHLFEVQAGVASLDRLTPGLGQNESSQSVALSGTRLAYGLPAASLGTACFTLARNFETGAARLIDVGAQQLRFVAEFFAGRPTDPGNARIAIDRDTMLVGLPITTALGFDSGLAVLYRRNAGAPTTWLPLRKLQPVRLNGADRFGTSVDLDDDVAVVGAPGAERRTAPNVIVGEAIAFARNEAGPDTWQQSGSVLEGGRGVATSLGRIASATGFDVRIAPILPPFDGEFALTPSLASAGAESVSMDGARLLIGSPNAQLGGLSGAGAAFVFQYSSLNGWLETRVLAAPDAVAQDHFGTSVSLDGDVAAIGAPDHPPPAGAGTGTVYVHQRNAGGSGQWNATGQVALATLAANERFGSDVELEGDAIAASISDLANEPRRGAIFVRTPRGTGAFASLLSLDTPLPSAASTPGVALSAATAGLAGTPGAIAHAYELGSAATACTITSIAPTSSVVSEPYTVAVTASASAGGAAPGTVVVSEGAETCEIKQLVGSGSCVLRSSTAGTRSMVASYLGAAGLASSVSAPQSHTVSPASLNPLLRGDLFALRGFATFYVLDLPPVAPATQSPLGATVTIGDGSTSCSATIEAVFPPAAFCSLIFTQLGSRTVTGTFAANGNYLAASSSLNVIVYDPTDLSVSVTAVSGIAFSGENAVYTVTIRNEGPADATPANSVLQVSYPNGQPAPLTGLDYSCVASGGATCPPNGSVVGAAVNLAGALGLPSGGQLVFTLTARTLAGAALTANLLTSATVSHPVPGGDTDFSNNDAFATVPTGIFRNGFD